MYNYHIIINVTKYIAQNKKVYDWIFHEVVEQIVNEVQKEFYTENKYMNVDMFLHNEWKLVDAIIDEARTNDLPF